MEGEASPPSVEEVGLVPSVPTTARATVHDWR